MKSSATVRASGHISENMRIDGGDAVVAEHHEAAQQLAGGALLDRVPAGVDTLRAPADDAGHPTDPAQASGAMDPSRRDS